MIRFVGGTVDFAGGYPGWAYRPDSALRELMVQVYREMYGQEPVVEAIHAGLECGLISAKLPGLDCVSIGPNLLDIHTPRERMEIASVQRVDPRQMRWVVPLFGGYGFFGYYGYYFDLKTFEKVVVYASEWKNLVEIVDIYEQRYYVSCTQADELVALLQSE